jgi:hypothetical protein
VALAGSRHDHFPVRVLSELVEHFGEAGAVGVGLARAAIVRREPEASAETHSSKGELDGIFQRLFLTVWRYDFEDARLSALSWRVVVESELWVVGEQDAKTAVVFLLE